MLILGWLALTLVRILSILYTSLSWPGDILKDLVDREDLDTACTMFAWNLTGVDHSIDEKKRSALLFR